MSAHLCCVLIFTGLTGIHSITTVSKVSVKAGGSVSVPCLYEYEYRDNVKYLCEGFDWLLCNYRIKTNEPKQSSGRFLISDDKQRQVFTVKINDLMNKDIHYWCAVEKKIVKDVKQYFKISVAAGTPRLYVDHQEMTGFRGEDLTINCHYNMDGKNQWCRLGGSCVQEQSGSIDGTNVTITDNSSVFTVTMRGLRMESSGWYFCAKGDLQMPVHVTVKQRPTTTTSQLNTFSPVNHTSVSVSASQEPTAVHGGYHSFIIPLTLLIFLVMVVILAWLMCKRYEQAKGSSTPPVTGDEVTYAAVKHRRKPAGKRSFLETDEAVTYSSVIFIKHQYV